MYKNALSCAELLGEIGSSIEILDKLGQTDKIRKLIEEDKVSLGSYSDICAFIEGKTKKKINASKTLRLGIPDEKHQSWVLQFKEDIPEDKVSIDADQNQPIILDWDMQGKLNRLNLAFDEVPFVFNTNLLDS